MRQFLAEIWVVFRGDASGGRVVPKSGLSAWMIVLISAAMSVLAVVALAFTFSAGRIAQDWTEELAGAWTVRVSAPADQINEQVEAALRVLRTTPGVASADLIGSDAQAQLLEPWLGAQLDLSLFGLPALISVVEDETGLDRDGLLLRLKAEAPGAELDDHGRWRAPLISSAERIRRLGAFAFVLVLTVLGVMVAVSAQAAVLANVRNIKTLRLVGATDGFITRAFVRRLTLRAGLGALIGVAFGAVLVALAGGGASETQTLRLIGRDWIWVAALVPFVAILAFTASRLTVFAALKRLS